MLRLSDSVTCRKKYYNQSQSCLYLSFGTLKMNFRTFLNLTLISKFFMLSRLSDFVVCGTNLYLVVGSISKV